MSCPDCSQNLDDVPPGDLCPQCGGIRRCAQVPGEAAAVTVTAGAGTVKVGYSLKPGWDNQWRSIQRHLARLREQYRGIDLIGNVDMEETVHALFLALNHLCDWLHQDGDLSLDKATVRAFVYDHPGSLGVCRAYANTRKHMKRNRPGDLIAQITRFEAGPDGQTAIIGYGPGDQPAVSLTEVDALVLAEQCERDWRDLLTVHGIPIPP